MFTTPFHNINYTILLLVMSSYHSYCCSNPYICLTLNQCVMKCHDYHCTDQQHVLRGPLMKAIKNLMACFAIYQFQAMLGIRKKHPPVMDWNIPCSFIIFLHNKDIIYYFGSLLVNSGRFQLTSTISTTFLLEEFVVIKHGCHVVSCLYWQPQGCVFLFLAQPKGLHYASNII